MPSRKLAHPSPLRALLLCIIFGAIAPHVLAQFSGTATLPESNEAMILSSRVDEAVSAGDYPLAVRLINQIMDMSGDLVWDARQRVYYPVWRRAVHLLRALPPAAVKVYQQLYDAEVSTRLAEAKKTGDMAELRDLLRRFPISSVWSDVGCEMIALCLENGQFADALAVSRELESAGGAVTLDTKLAAIVALGMIGSASEADRRLRGLDAELGAAVPAQRDAARRIGEWLAKRAAGHEGNALAPLLSTPIQWRASLNGVDDGQTLTNDAAANAIGYQRALPLLTPVIEGDTLLVRARRVLWALDAVTLTRRWSVAETAFQEVQTPYSDFGGPPDDDSPDPNLPTEARMLLRGATQHRLSAAYGLVYTIEPRIGAESERAENQGMPGMGQMYPLQPNQLVARDVMTGEVEWRLGADPTDRTFYDASFQTAPLALDDRIIVLVQVRQDLVLAVLDPRSGKLQTRTLIVGPPIYLPMDGGRCNLVADETTLYLTTGNGVVAALDRMSLGWKWAATYATTNARRAQWFPWGNRIEEEPRRDFSIDPPVLAADLLVVAPADANEIIALDRFDGHVHWHIDRHESLVLLGAVSDGVLLGGSAVICLDVADGATVRWRSVPLELTGRVQVDQSVVFVPTRGGVLSLNARNGRVIAAQNLERIAPSNDALAGNLVIAGGALFVASPNDVTKYPDPVAAGAILEKRIAADPRDDRARLAQAWLRCLQRDYAGTLQILEKLDAPDQPVAAARDALLSSTFVALSQSSGGADERLTWLKRATSLHLGDESAADLTVLVGRTLEDAGRWDEALRHYRDALLRSSATSLIGVGEGYRRASWLDALARIRICLTHVNDSAQAEFKSELATSATQGADAGVMERSLRIIDDGPDRAAIERAIVLTAPPPELAADFLGAGGEVTDEAVRRRLLLERWDVHVALGQLDAARSDRELWVRDVGPLTRDDAAADSGEDTDAARQLQTDRERAIKIDRSMRKLADAQMRPFEQDFYHLWHDTCELVADGSFQAPPHRIPGLFVLTRSVEPAQLKLKGVKGDDRRVTDDSVKGFAAVARPGENTAQMQAWRMMGEVDETPKRLCWPSVGYLDRAAVATRGGVICVGMGPERRGGSRIWEYPTGWTDPPFEFVDRAAANAQGVCLRTRPSRIEMLDWMTGRPRWVRDVAPASVRKILMTGDVVIALTDDQKLVSIDAAAGEQVRAWPDSASSVLGALLVGDVLVVRSDESVAGYDPRTLERRWTILTQGTTCEPVVGRDWVMIRPRDVDWSVVDVQTGASVLSPSARTDDKIMAVAADQHMLFVATATERNGGRSREAHVQAFDAQTGKKAWDDVADVDAAADMNATQLIAHPRYVPILATGRSGSAEHAGEGGESQFSIVLIDKQDGKVLDRHPLDVFNEINAPARNLVCAPLLLASPTQMYVQANGVVAVYGNMER